MLVFKTAYTTLAARIRAKCPDIVYIGLWNDQPAHWEEEPVMLPAVLFSFEVDAWQDVAATGHQTGRGRLVAHILQECYTTAYETATGPNPGQSEALKRFELVQAVHNAIQNFSAAQFQSLSRSGQEFDASHDALIADAVMYATVWIDQQSTPAARQKYTTAATIEDVTVEPNTVPAPAAQSSPFFIP